ncbi:restriction endonuclease subunit S [Vibrio harveyi]|uniref:restriction endonuclease subunit S n=1 Tax=Vibrio harveyi TaxID=669 RepID=UPI0023807182|nr:restriction endonuclease subunit S [Vibrio harveyi]
MIKQTDENSHWERVKLDDIQVRISNGANVAQHDQKVGYPISRIETIWNETIDFERVKYIEEKDEDFVEKYKLQKGDILFSHINSDFHLGKTAIVKNTQQTLIHGINLLLIRLSDNVSSEFVNYQFKYLRYKGLFIAHAQRAVNQSSINQKKLKNFDFVLPPLNEQQRIVEKIEELFSELDSGIKSLTKTKQQMAVYRQALLKQAFEGKLTAQWREDNPDKLESPDDILERLKLEREEHYQQKIDEWKVAVNKWEQDGSQGKKPSKPRKTAGAALISETEVSRLPNLPVAWRYLRFGEFIYDINAGKSFKCDEREPSSNEIGVAKVSAVSWGEYDESESKTCTDASKVNEEYFIKSNDFILSRANTIELVGACVIVKNTSKNIMLSDKTLRLNCLGNNDHYFLQYLRSWTGRKEIMERSTGNQDSMRNIGQDRIKSICIPVCSQYEMEEITTILESKLSILDKQIEDINVNIKKAELLRQSILKKAFSGQLVSQDPEDEAASELLKKIAIEKEELAEKDKAEKAAARKKKSTVKKTVKS